MQTTELESRIKELQVKEYNLMIELFRVRKQLYRLNSIYLKELKSQVAKAKSKKNPKKN